MVSCVAGAAAGPTFGGCTGLYRVHPTDHLPNCNFHGRVFRHAGNRFLEAGSSLVVASEYWIFRVC